MRPGGVISNVRADEWIRDNLRRVRYDRTVQRNPKHAFFLFGRATAPVRRTFLRGAGVLMSLPLLDAMSPALGQTSKEVPRRMVAIETNMGILPQFFFPEKAGRDYELTPVPRTARERIATS